LQEKSRMKNIEFSDFPGVQFGKNVTIRGINVTICNGVIIADNVSIESEDIYIGYNSVIEVDTIIKAIGGKTMESFYVGDNCFIGFKNQILVPKFVLKDFSQIHNSCLCSGYKPLLIGYNCWIGQGAILNSFEDLTLHNNVRMGGSQVWTHVASGEVLEGSNFFGAKPVVIEDNVWLMGFGHLITPGVILKRGSVIMAGSTITKSTEEYGTYSGIPAKNISEKLPAWTKKTVQEKFKMMHQFVEEFTNACPQYANQICFVSSQEINAIEEMKENCERKGYKILIFDDIDLLKHDDFKFSIFDVNTKQYLKQRTEIEIDFIKFNLGYRARFTPFKSKVDV